MFDVLTPAVSAGVPAATGAGDAGGGELPPDPPRRRGCRTRPLGSQTTEETGCRSRLDLIHHDSAKEKSKSGKFSDMCRYSSAGRAADL